MKLFRAPQNKPALEHNPEPDSEVLPENTPEAKSAISQQPIRHGGVHMKWEVVNGKLTSRWFQQPD